MDTLTAIETRRAVKHYQANQTLPAEHVTTLQRAAQLAPTSFNIQHTRIVRVTDPAQRRALRQAAWDQAQVTDAAELWVICADIQAWQKQPQRYWQQADNATQATIIDMLTNFYAGKPQLQRDEALRSCGMVAQTVMLAARSLGYDSCPMIGFDADAVARQIALPDDHLIGLMLAIGSAAQPAKPRGGLLTPDQVLLHDRFEQPQTQAA